MDPVKTEERFIKHTDWAQCDNVYRYCAKCKSNPAVMQKRIVTGRDGDSHTEYRIQCTYCGQKSDVHMSRNLTIFDWDGLQEEKDTPKIYRRKK